MTLEYFYKTGEIHRWVNYGYGPEKEWDGDEGYDFEYDIYSDQIKKALSYILMNNGYDKLKDNNEFKKLVQFPLDICQEKQLEIIIDFFISLIDDADLLDDFAEQFRNEITDYYEDEAMETQRG